MADILSITEIRIRAQTREKLLLIMLQQDGYCDTAKERNRVYKASKPKRLVKFVT